MMEWPSKEERLGHMDKSGGSSAKTEAMDHWKNPGPEKNREFYDKK